MQNFVDDTAIVRGCIGRDLEAWSALVHKYSPLIRISIKNRLKKHTIDLPAQDIEDIRQNIFTLLWKDNKLESVKNRKNITYWLAMVSGNMAMEYARKKIPHQSFEALSLADKINETEFSEVLSSGKIGPSDEAAAGEVYEKIEGTIESLPAKEAVIAKLHLIHGKKYHEIAVMLDCPEGTVSSYIKRIKEKLRAVLKDFK